MTEQEKSYKVMILGRKRSPNLHYESLMMLQEAIKIGALKIEVIDGTNDEIQRLRDEIIKLKTPKIIFEDVLRG